MKKVGLDKIIKIGFVSSVFIFVVGVGFKLYLCSSLAVRNSELEQASVKKQQLEKDILKLSFEDSHLSSIAFVEVKAKSMGFVEMTDRLISINPNAPIKVAALTR